MLRCASPYDAALSWLVQKSSVEPTRLVVLLQLCIQVYSERFRHLKAPRKLRWLPTAGLVELSVSIGESDPIDFKVTPVHAALLMQFAEEPSADSVMQDGADAKALTKTAAQLSAALGVPVPVIRNKAMFWVSAGVLLEKRGAAGEVTYSRATSIDPSRIGETWCLGSKTSPVYLDMPDLVKYLGFLHIYQVLAVQRTCMLRSCC